METIEVKKQRQLTLRETFEFCLSSIKHRLGRSLLTLAVVTLAVAFFMYLQSSNIFRNSVKSGVEQEMLTSRRPAKLLSILYTQYSQNDFTNLLATSRNDKQDIARFSKILNLSEEDTMKLAENAYTEQFYNNYIAGMPIGKRKDLFDRKIGREIFVFLQDEENFEKTLDKMREIGGMRIPGGSSKLKSFLKDYTAYAQQLDKAFDSFNQFQTKLTNADVPRNDAAQLRKYVISISKDPAKLNAWRSVIADAGFELDDVEFQSILHYQEMSEAIEKVSSLLYEPDYRKKWRRVYGQSKYNTMDSKLAVLDAPKTLEILEGAEYEGNTLITLDQLKGIAKEFRSRKHLRDLEVYLGINLFEETTGFSSSQIYLMALSFLVCVVGITNAMLMSITERFREIATLKCLGATDSFILIQIVLEAMIQGLVGSLIGVVIGFIVALIASSLQVGLRVFSTFDFGMIGLAALTSLLAGMLLSVLASLYPSAKAARMAPMEAMRVE